MSSIIILCSSTTLNGDLTLLNFLIPVYCASPLSLPPGGGGSCLCRRCREGGRRKGRRGGAHRRRERGGGGGGGGSRGGRGGRRGRARRGCQSPGLLDLQLLLATDVRLPAGANTIRITYVLDNFLC